jgi:hypothetical protein
VTVLTLITVYLVRRYSRERNLITSGCAAQGTVLSMKHFKTRNGQYIKLTYTFTDNMGQIVEGKSNVGAQSIDANNVTILYDPGDSSRNAAYPMQFAKCQQSETLYGS